MAQLRISWTIDGRTHRSLMITLRVGDMETDAKRLAVVSSDDTDVCGFARPVTGAFRSRCTSLRADTVVDGWCMSIGGDPATPFSRAVRQLLMHFTPTAVRQIAHGRVGVDGAFAQTAIVYRSAEGERMTMPCPSAIDLRSRGVDAPYPRACVVWAVTGEMSTNEDDRGLRDALDALALRINMRFPTIVRLHVLSTQSCIRLALVEQRPRALRPVLCDDTKGDACPVCLEALDTETPACMLSCGHVMHATCIERVMMKRVDAHEDTPASCPMCRAKIQ